jgi:hypothetical protein
MESVSRHAFYSYHHIFWYVKCGFHCSVEDPISWRHLQFANRKVELRCIKIAVKLINTWLETSLAHFDRVSLRYYIYRCNVQKHCNCTVYWPWRSHDNSYLPWAARAIRSWTLKLVQRVYHYYQHVKNEVPKIAYIFFNLPTIRLLKNIFYQIFQILRIEIVEQCFTADFMITTPHLPALSAVISRHHIKNDLIAPIDNLYQN